MSEIKSKEKIIQNLKDANCRDEQIYKFMTELEKGNTKAALNVLAQHRNELLINFHKTKYCIDCLDYLVCSINKKQEAYNHGID